MRVAADECLYAYSYDARRYSTHHLSCTSTDPADQETSRRDSADSVGSADSSRGLSTASWFSRFSAQGGRPLLHKNASVLYERVQNLGRGVTSRDNPWNFLKFAGFQSRKWEFARAALSMRCVEVYPSAFVFSRFSVRWTLVLASICLKKLRDSWRELEEELRCFRDLLLLVDSKEHLYVYVYPFGSHSALEC